MIDVKEIREFLKAAAGGEKSELAATNYTGSPRVHLGIGAPGLHDFVAELITEHKSDLTLDAAIPLLTALYAGETVEEPILAGLLLAKLPGLRQALSLEILEGWLDQLTGWVEVDSTCQSTFPPKELYQRWEDWSALLRRLNGSPNINKRRASLVLLIRTVRESDDPRGIGLVFELTEPLKHERDKLITKAISWVLREGAKRHSEAVSGYVDAHARELASHIVREVRVKLETGKKKS